MTIAQAFIKLFGILQTVLSLLGLIQGSTAKAAQENVPFTIDTLVGEYLPIIGDSSVGLAAIKAELLIIDAHIATVDSSLSAAIAAAQQTGSPVTLPTTPPSGYAPPNVTDIAYKVWHFTMDDAQQTQELMIAAGNLGLNMGLTGVMLQSYTQPWFTVGGTWASNLAPDTYNADPIFPISNILSTDTLSSFLERESFWTGWTDYLGSGYLQVAQGGGGDWFYMTTINGTQFIALRDSIFAPTSLRVPPIWPGLALVTLGSPVTLTAATVVNGPMDGILIALTAVPPNKPYYVLGTQTATAHIGQVAFEDDNNDMEYPQNLSFANQVYCPQSMVNALACMVRCIPGVVGTATPWTVT